MAQLQASTLRATGTYNIDFRLSPPARGLLVVANITAKGAGASTLRLSLQYLDEASATYEVLADAVQLAVESGAVGQAVTPTEKFVVGAYPGFGIAAPAAGKKRFFSAAVPTSLRLVAIVAVDTITFSVASKALF
jgi:hypothetical protein